jgi:membrane associated rhomboid family serine protease
MLHISRLKTRFKSLHPSWTPSSARIAENAFESLKSILSRSSAIWSESTRFLLPHRPFSLQSVAASRNKGVELLKTANKLSVSIRPFCGLPKRSFPVTSVPTRPISLERIGKRHYSPNWNYQKGYRAWNSPDGLFHLSWRKPISLIIAANVGVYLMWATVGNTQVGHQWMTENWMVSVTTWKSHPWTLITSAFSHSSMLHLLFNMIAIGTIGRDLQVMLGNRRFLSLYLGAAVMGSFGHLWWSSARQPANWVPRSETIPIYILADGTMLLPRDVDTYVKVHGELPPSTPLHYVSVSEDHVWAPALGASAAAAALFGLAATLWPQRSFLFLVFPVRASRLLAGFIAFSTFSLLLSPDSHIGHAAHLSGLAVGVATALLTRGKVLKL